MSTLLATPPRAHPTHTGGCRTLNAFSVDVEEYFQAEAFARTISPSDWPNWPCRALPCLERIAACLEAQRRRATFFVLGWTVRSAAGLLRQLAAAGHEIACHGDRHQHLARMTPQTLREDLHAARSRIEDAVGVSPRGYRAPTFSLTRRTSWALDVIAEAGFEYDASIFPIRHDRYGVPQAPVAPFVVRSAGGARLLEFPPLTLAWGPLRIPVGGGGYLRLLPRTVLHRALAARVRRGAPALLYVHPWELDPDQPSPPLPRLARWRHRVNLARTEQKLTRLLRDFEFDTVAAVLGRVRRLHAMPEFTLA